jgi:hypothetical protein
MKLTQYLGNNFLNEKRELGWKVNIWNHNTVFRNGPHVAQLLTEGIYSKEPSWAYEKMTTSCVMIWNRNKGSYGLDHCCSGLELLAKAEKRPHRKRSSDDGQLLHLLPFKDFFVLALSLSYECTPSVFLKDKTSYGFIQFCSICIDLQQVLLKSA